MDKKTYDANFIDIQFTPYEVEEIVRALGLSLGFQFGEFRDKVRSTQHERLTKILQMRAEERRRMQAEIDRLDSVVANLMDTPY